MNIRATPSIKTTTKNTVFDSAVSTRWVCLPGWAELATLDYFKGTNLNIWGKLFGFNYRAGDIDGWVKIYGKYS